MAPKWFFTLGDPEEVPLSTLTFWWLLSFTSPTNILIKNFVIYSLHINFVYYMLDNKASHKFITISSRLPNPAPAMLVCLSCCSDEQNTAIAAILTTSLSRQLPKHRAAGPAAAAQRPWLPVSNRKYGQGKLSDAKGQLPQASQYAAAQTANVDLEL